MFYFCMCFVLIIVTDSSSSFVIESDDSNYELEWPLEYRFKAEKLCLKTGIVETYEVWYSEDKNRSRVDFYNGMDKRYSYTNEEYSLIYKIHPQSDNGEESTIVCDMTRFDAVENYLPNAENFIFEGHTTYDNKVIGVWKSIEEEDEIYKVEQVLYAYLNDEELYIPVKLEKTHFNTYDSAIDRHSITNFYSFLTNVSSGDLDAMEVRECNETETLGKDLKNHLQFLNPHFDGHVNIAFQSFKKHHKRVYTHHEHEKRKLIFEENWRRIAEHNKRNLGYKLEVNKFADRFKEELAQLTGTWPSDSQVEGSEHFPFTEDELEDIAKELPDDYDMRIDGVISAVKNQGYTCGSCWAFSTTAAVESTIARRNGGRNIELSEQSLIDCSWNPSRGCDGGFLPDTFKFLTKHGLPTRMEYGPYLEQNGYCKLQNMTTTYTIRGFAKVPSLSEMGFRVTLYKYGPVAVVINAEEPMLYYSSGVFYDPDCNKKRINHAVTVVGYGIRDGVSYWIVKNSWGEDWGQDGYILMSATNDNCLLMTDGYYAIV